MSAAVPAGSMEMVAALAQIFQKRFGAPPRIFRAPGRVNLIGEHTDYNEGFVMPAAISRFTYAAMHPRTDRKLRIASRNFEGHVEVDIDALAPRRHWSDYITGVAEMLRRDGIPMRGADLMFWTEVPIGAGLSSSAALEMATALALTATDESLHAAAELDAPKFRPLRIRLALAAQHAEQEFNGTQCGIMDQFISALGRERHALLLDCRSLEFELVELPPRYVLAICNTGVMHDLATSQYNERRAECEKGVAMLREKLPAIVSLRDVTLQDFQRYQSALPEVVRKRCRHVIEENQRVLDTRDALHAGDMQAVGHYFAHSHESLRDDYQVSCAELDSMVEIASRAPGFAAGRMTGGGFGGCTVNLVESNQASAFAHYVTDQYARNWPQYTAEVYLVTSVDGGCEMPEPAQSNAAL